MSPQVRPCESVESCKSPSPNPTMIPIFPSWLVALAFVFSFVQQASAAIDSATTKSIPPTGECKKGPWGKLVFHEAYLEASEELLSYYPLPSTTTCWTVNEASLDAFTLALSKTNIPATSVKLMLSPGHAVRMDGKICVFPSADLVVALTADDRAQLYSFLGQFPENEFIVNPVFFGRGGVDKWLNGTELTPKIQGLVKKLVWQRGHALVMSDIEVLLGGAVSNKEAQEIFRTCTRTRTLMLQLVLEDTTNLNDLGTYWVKGHSKKRIIPFLESMRASGQGRPIYCDIIHLFSAFMRQLLYTYPDLSLAKNGRFPDCHWTSLNFFNFAPREYYLNTKLAADVVLQDYNPVEAPYEFGDVLMFIRDGGAVHSCVYIADDIVFTKNGENIVNPWMLSRLEEVQDVYQFESQVKIQGFRKKMIQGINPPDDPSTK